MDTRRLRFAILPEEGCRTNAQRLSQYRLNRICFQANPDVKLFIPLYSPPTTRLPTPRIRPRLRRLPAEWTNGALALTAWGLIAVAIFESWSR